MRNILWLSYLSPEEQIAFCKNLVNGLHIKSMIRIIPSHSIGHWLAETNNNWYNFIGSNFDWSATSEGPDYWLEICNRTHPEFVGDIAYNAGLTHLIKMPYRMQVQFLRNLSTVNATGGFWSGDRRISSLEIDKPFWPIDIYLLGSFHSFEEFITNSFIWTLSPERRSYWEGIANCTEYNTKIIKI
jgi:hypothetical protein